MIAENILIRCDSRPWFANCDATTMAEWLQLGRARLDPPDLALSWVGRDRGCVILLPPLRAQVEVKGKREPVKKIKKKRSSTESPTVEVNLSCFQIQQVEVIIIVFVEHIELCFYYKIFSKKRLLVTCSRCCVGAGTEEDCSLQHCSVSWPLTLVSYGLGSDRVPKLGINT